MTPAYIVFDNYEKILNWNRSLRFALAVCTLKRVLRMKFNLIIILFFLFSCAPHYTKIDSKKPYVSKGFALIYNDKDYENKLVLGKLNNETLQISHKNLKTGSLIKIINLNSRESCFKKYKKN